MAIYIIFAVAGVVLGYCIYRGALVPAENAISPSDLDDIFDDSRHGYYNLCPVTGGSCVGAKCGPAAMQEYYKAKAYFLCAYFPPFGIFTFGWQWFLFSAASVVLAGTWALAIAAVPLVVAFILSKIGKRTFQFPVKFSDACPREADVEQFESFIERYCMYLNYCTCAMQKMSKDCKKFYTIASHIAYVAAPFAIYAIIKYYRF